MLPPEGMNMKYNRKKLAFLLLPLLTGGLAGWITKDSIAQFAQIRKPVLSPPGWVFPVVWTLLYLLMGWASYRFYLSAPDAQTRRRGLLLYLGQLAVNFLWPILFFSFRAYLPAFVWILLLWGLVLATTLSFFAADSPAGRAMLSYLLWVTFAAYLNLGVALLNP